jgi:hypothetical protein
MEFSLTLHIPPFWLAYLLAPFLGLLIAQLRGPETRQIIEPGGRQPTGQSSNGGAVASWLAWAGCWECTAPTVFAWPGLRFSEWRATIRGPMIGVA